MKLTAQLLSKYIIQILIITLFVILFGNLLQFVIHINKGMNPLFIFGLIPTLIITKTLYKLYFQDLKYVFNLLYNSISQLTIPFIHIPLLIFTTLLSHLFGASIGREGVAVQIGVTTSNWLNRVLFTEDIARYNNYFLTIGISTGFATLFGFPVAATAFALEVLSVRLPRKEKFYVFPFALIGALFGAKMGTYLQLPRLIVSSHRNNFTYEIFPQVFLLIILIVTFAVIYLKFQHFLDEFLKKSKKRITPILLTSLLCTIILLFNLDSFKGLGSDLIDASITDPQSISLLSPFIKMSLTIIFVSLGFKGGEVTPIFSIGAMLGACSLQLLPYNSNSEFIVILGIASYFAVLSRSIFAPTFILIEIFQFQITLDFLLVTISTIIFVYFITKKFEKFALYRKEFNEKNNYYSN